MKSLELFKIKCREFNQHSSVMISHGTEGVSISIHDIKNTHIPIICEMTIDQAVQIGTQLLVRARFVEQAKALEVQNAKDKNQTLH